MNDDSKRFCGSGRIKGVCCDVMNCVYHSSDNCCTAGEITVGPSHASTVSDTSCATFKKDEK